MYRIVLTKTAQKTYERLSEKLRRGLDRCIAHLSASPTLGPNVKRLSGQPDCYRYQMGGWRILYEVDEDAATVKIYQIRPRGDAYKH